MWLMNHIFNPLVRLILKSPLHGMFSGSIVLLIYRGKKSGKKYEIPVQYVQENNRVYILPGNPEQKTWWRNFRSGAAVQLVLRGKTWAGQAGLMDPETDLAEAQKALDTYFHRYPPSARSRQVSVQPDGSYKFDDVVSAAKSTLLLRVELEDARS